MAYDLGANPWSFRGCKWAYYLILIYINIDPDACLQ